MGVIFVAGIVVWGMAIMFFDATYQRIPNWLSIPGVAIIWAFSLCSTPIDVNSVTVWLLSPVAVVGGVCWWLLIVLLGVVGGRRLRAGAGDAKLALSVGTLAASTGLGALGWFATVGLAGAFGVLSAALCRRSGGVPQGPAMVVGMGAVALYATVCCAL